MEQNRFVESEPPPFFMTYQYFLRVVSRLGKTIYHRTGVSLVYRIQNFINMWLLVTFSILYKVWRNLLKFHKCLLGLLEGHLIVYPGTLVFKLMQHRTSSWTISICRVIWTNLPFQTTLLCTIIKKKNGRLNSLAKN